MAGEVGGGGQAGGLTELEAILTAGDPASVDVAMQAISRRIYPANLTLRYLPIDGIREQDLNARSMPKATFDQLVQNIKDAGAPESVPLCNERPDGTIELISGHHRLRAARQAGQAHMLVLVYRNLSKSKVRAKQLAHNSISGKDDPAILRRLWAEIEEATARFEAHIDPRIFDDMPKPVAFTPVDVDLNRNPKLVWFLFLPVQAGDIAAMVDRLTGGEPDTLYLARREDFDAWKDALARVRTECEIVAVPTAVAMMARLAVEALDARKEARDALQPVVLDVGADQPGRR